MRARKYLWNRINYRIFVPTEKLCLLHIPLTESGPHTVAVITLLPEKFEVGRVSNHSILAAGAAAISATHEHVPP